MAPSLVLLLGDPVLMVQNQFLQLAPSCLPPHWPACSLPRSGGALLHLHRHPAPLPPRRPPPRHHPLDLAPVTQRLLASHVNLRWH